ncbi:putative exported protein [Halobacteriovorax marinus SJ]|uniref:Exported protein n=1 Tax=Halobacteriovorax marinus (strain ATCC BAA-682 / DSM 15412 / SJ) TaxID=862908 RepID=E1X410_HALMS|nr:chalcone isomerase family protein [Halobacteriovorax marinus]CBW25350.1 putative exported protein [Halobacteriovorax marinus SJ]
MNKILISILFLFNLSISAATQDGITLPDTVKLSGKELVLNGLGTRKATWLGIKVYVGGLYMQKKSSDYKTFLNDQSPKQIIMEFVRDVDADDLIGGWKDAFKNSVKADDMPKLKDRIEKFYTYFTDIKKGQKMTFNFLADGVESTINGKALEKINGADFSKAMLSVWFINATDKGLKDGLLGL